MRKLLFVLLAVFIAAPMANAAQYREGTHYQEIPFPTTVETGKKIEVREYFWYGCPHCYRLEPSVVQWLKHMPKNAAFVRTPGTASHWLTHARAYYTYDVLGVVDKLHGPTFDAIHKHKQHLRTASELAELAARHGVDKDKFISTFNSFGVNLLVENAKHLNQEAGIRSVPSFVVDGKYRTDQGMAGGTTQLFKVIEFLIKKSARERGKKK